MGFFDIFKKKKKMSDGLEKTRTDFFQNIVNTLTSGTPARSAQVSSCSLAAARKVSPAASMTRLPKSLYR